MRRIKILNKRMSALKAHALNARMRYDSVGYSLRNNDLAEMPVIVEEAISNKNWKVAASLLKKQERKISIFFDELDVIEKLQKFISQNG